MPTTDRQEKSVILATAWHTHKHLLIPPEYGWLSGYKNKTAKMLINKPMEENPSKNRTEALAAIQTGCSPIRMNAFKTDSIEAKSEYICLKTRIFSQFRIHAFKTEYIEVFIRKCQVKNRVNPFIFRENLNKSECIASISE